MKADKLREKYAAKTTGYRPLLTHYAIWLEEQLIASQQPIEITEGEIEELNGYDYFKDEPRAEAFQAGVDVVKAILDKLKKG